MKTEILREHKAAIAGEPEGVPLVFLHGLGATHRQSLDALASVKGAKFICPDMPGHGASESANYSFEHFARLVLRLMDSLNLERAVVGGISMGSGIALRLALEAPDRVDGLVLARPAWTNSPAVPHLSLVARVGRWQQDMPEEAERLLEDDPEFLRIRRYNPAAADSIRGLLRRSPSEDAGVLDAMVYTRPFSRMRDLETINCPSFVFASEGDPLHPVAIAQDIYANLPNAQFRLLPPRYLSPQEHFAAFANDLTPFLTKLGDR